MATSAPTATNQPMAQDSLTGPPSAPAASAAPPSTTPKAAAPSRKRVFVVGGALVLAGVATAYWVHSRGFEETDDAQIDGTISNVSPKVTGNVLAVFVSENQIVKAGDVLATIDPTDVQIALDQAKAQVAGAEAQLEAEDPSVPITQSTNESALATARSDVAGSQAALSAARSDVEQLTAQIAQATANDRQAQLEKERSQKLVATGAVSQADYDQRLNAAAATGAAVEALRQSLAAAKDRVTQQQANIGAIASHYTEIQSNAPRQVATRRASVIIRQAALDLAKAQEAQAEKNLEYTKIVAPVSGIVAKKSLAVGDHIAPGQQVVAIAQTDGLYVTADFRETQLERMQVGQSATISVDATGDELHGSIESLGGATGSRMSVLPPENASGNYVKVVQRIPVRIKLEPGQAGLDRLRIGMSVTPKVTLR